MKILDGRYDVEEKDHRYRIHPIENNNLRKRDQPQSQRNQNKYKIILRSGKIRGLLGMIMMN